jgi:hypothetical protein
MRGAREQRIRAAGLWLAVTGAAAGAWGLAAPVAAQVADAPARTGTFAELLEPVSAAALLGAVTWLWALATVTVAGVLRDRVPEVPTGVVRRLVLVACGVAVAAGTAGPVAAADGDGTLAGLRLPERAVSTRPTAAAAHRPAPPTDARVHVVRHGASLWSVAAATAPPGADVDARWRAIWAANRDVVGDDPDLILPGQRLRLPPSQPSSATDTTRGSAPDQTGDRP